MFIKGLVADAGMARKGYKIQLCAARFGDTKVFRPGWDLADILGI